MVVQINNCKDNVVIDVILSLESPFWGSVNKFENTVNDYITEWPNKNVQVS